MRDRDWETTVTTSGQTTVEIDTTTIDTVDYPVLKIRNDSGATLFYEVFYTGAVRERF